MERECSELPPTDLVSSVTEFDMIELPIGFIQLPILDLPRRIKRVKMARLEPKPEIGIQFGAGGDTSQAELRAEGTCDPQISIATATERLNAGASIIMIESGGITENADPCQIPTPLQAHKS
jgi:phosphosulfolactate synthase (CoM biosynthesis protein A)